LRTRTSCSSIGTSASATRGPQSPRHSRSGGIEAIVGESFGSAFADDCRAADIATVTASEGDVRAVQEWTVENPGGKLKVDVADELLVYGVRNHDEREADTYSPASPPRSSSPSPSPIEWWSRLAVRNRHDVNI
jgi:hypothetical protein